ncbi:hypothetical protein HY573_00590 [Candidatus Parcubacteria bacterium]|nr:hypothetical protein [Candidatus Parcubacteria bacterium]
MMGWFWVMAALCFCFVAAGLVAMASCRLAGAADEALHRDYAYDEICVAGELPPSG